MTVLVTVLVSVVVTVLVTVLVTGDCGGDCGVCASEGAVGIAAGALAEGAPPGLQGEQDSHGPQQPEELEDQPLPLPLHPGQQGVRGCHAPGQCLLFNLWISSQSVAASCFDFDF